jgi:hypothetical protein
MGSGLAPFHIFSTLVCSRLRRGGARHLPPVAATGSLQARVLMLFFATEVIFDLSIVSLRAAIVK